MTNPPTLFWKAPFFLFLFTWWCQAPLMPTLQTELKKYVFKFKLQRHIVSTSPHPPTYSNCQSIKLKVRMSKCYFKAIFIQLLWLRHLWVPLVVTTSARLLYRLPMDVDIGVTSVADNMLMSQLACCLEVLRSWWTTTLQRWNVHFTIIQWFWHFYHQHTEAGWFSYQKSSVNNLCLQVEEFIYHAF